MSDLLAADEIQVWCLRPEALQQPTAALLDEAEAAQAARFVFERDRQLYRAAHALLRLSLSAATALRPPQDWRFRIRPEGKPAVEGEGPACNLTHTTGLAACALMAGGEIGIDAEFDRRADTPLEVARKVFTPREQAWLGAAPPEGRSTAFYGLWTLKEATMKARGLGFRLSPLGLAASVDPPAVRQAHPGPWGFALFRPTPDHHLAIAAHAEPLPRRLRWRHLDGPWQEAPLVPLDPAG